MMVPLANIVQPLIDVADSMLRWMHNSLGLGWGWSIILLTVIVRAVLVPLTYKQLKAMARMQEFQPAIKEIQEKYKEDPQRKQQETMKFFQENKINPFRIDHGTPVAKRGLRSAQMRPSGGSKP